MTTGGGGRLPAQKETPPGSSQGATWRRIAFLGTPAMAMFATNQSLGYSVSQVIDFFKGWMHMPTAVTAIVAELGTFIQSECRRFVLEDLNSFNNVFGHLVRYLQFLI
jgi:hypothetical protein